MKGIWEGNTLLFPLQEDYERYFRSYGTGSMWPQESWVVALDREGKPFSRGWDQESAQRFIDHKWVGFVSGGSRIRKVKVVYISPEGRVVVQEQE